jgi:DNA-binding transcriptional MerR regulator
MSPLPLADPAADPHDDTRTGWLTLGRLARRSGLARASLLHYEQLGLLQPSGRSAAGYRLYGPREQQRLQLIRQFRTAGLSLDTIGELLARDTPADTPATRLTERLQAIQAEVDRLRRQQHTLARLLAGTSPATWAACHDKASWSALLHQAGFSDADMHRWHADFEHDDPAGHQRFLAALNLPDDEIRRIRRWSADHASDDPTT